MRYREVTTRLSPRLGHLVLWFCGFATLGSLPGELGAQGGRRDRIHDHFSERTGDRQRPGTLGRHHDRNDPRLDRFRTIDGSFNNQRQTRWGVAGANLYRKVAAAYLDGLSDPPRQAMPSPREISNALFDQSGDIPNQLNLTDMVWQWGQFLDHDIDLTETAIPLEPYPISVPSGDPWFDPEQFGSIQISFFRSQYQAGTGVGSPRQQVNAITSWIDGSQVYGSDEVTMRELRHFRRGMLRVSPHATGHLLPVDDEGFFLAGDIRVNEQVGLISMHTLFLREHNRICRRMLKHNPKLTDEQLYWNARKRVIALIQSITYNEFLPAILGPDAIPPYQRYRPNVFPNIANCFSTGAYRFGHSMLSPTLLRLDNDLNVIPEGNLPLAEAFFNPDEIRNHGIDPYLNGLINHLAQDVDGKVVDDVRNFLFGPPGAGGFDLVSLNIQRGRDHGLPSLNAIRQRYGLPAAETFADLTTNTDVQDRLAELYGDVENADPWVAMLCEDHVPGAIVGPTAFAVIRDQFIRLRDADRFWYQKEFQGSTRNSIENTRLSHVIRRNTGIKTLRRDVFRLPFPTP